MIPDGAYGARGGGETVGLRCADDLACSDAALNGGHPRVGVNRDALHSRHVDNQATVSQRPAGPVMAAAANRQRQVVVARRENRGLHLSVRFWPHDQGRFMSDGSVPDLHARVICGPRQDATRGQIRKQVPRWRGHRLSFGRHEYSLLDGKIAPIER